MRKGGRGSAGAAGGFSDADSSPNASDLSTSAWNTPGSLKTTDFESLGSPQRGVGEAGGFWGEHVGRGEDRDYAGLPSGGMGGLSPVGGGQRFLGDVDGVDIGALRLLIETNVQVAKVVFQLRVWALDWLKDLHASLRAGDGGNREGGSGAGTYESAGSERAGELMGHEWAGALRAAADDVEAWGPEDLQVEAEAAESVFPAMQVRQKSHTRALHPAKRGLYHPERHLLTRGAAAPCRAARGALCRDGANARRCPRGCSSTHPTPRISWQPAPAVPRGFPPEDPACAFAPPRRVSRQFWGGRCSRCGRGGGGGGGGGGGSGGGCSSRCAIPAAAAGWGDSERERGGRGEVGGNVEWQDASVARQRSGAQKSPVSAIKEPYITHKGPRITHTNILHRAKQTH